MTEPQQVKVPLGKKKVLPASRGYAVKDWLTVQGDLKGAKEKLPAIPDGSTVFFKANDPAAQLFKMELRGRSPAVVSLHGQGDDIAWGDSTNFATLRVGTTYGAIWMTADEAKSLPIEMLTAAFALEWNKLKPSAADADALRFVVRRGIRVELNLKWFDGSPAQYAPYTLELGGKHVLKGAADIDGLCAVFAPTPEGATTLRITGTKGELWNRPFRIAL